MEKRSVKTLVPMGLLLLGIAVRLYQFGTVPGGLNQDEAFAAYDAWSMLTSGTDSAGYRFPVYLSAWGSGMNALESYLMIPFLAIFGTAAWVVRLPQLLVGCLSMAAAYDLAGRCADRRTALCFLGLMAISPWHIMLSRWALESNLAPGFLLFGLYFFVRGLENRRWLLLSALMYGLSLYAYATIWPMVPMILLLQLLCCRKKLSINRYSSLALLILLLLALPLLLFLAVNTGILPEIRGPLLSIPKMLVMRSGEISLRHIPENLKHLGKLLLFQSDGLIWNSSRQGLVYHLSTPLFLLGLGASLGNRCRGRKDMLESLMGIWLLAGILLGALVQVNVNRVNLIFIPILFFAARGLTFLWNRLGRGIPWLALGVYGLMLMSFLHYYFGDFAETIPYYFNEGLDTALEAVADRPGTVYLDDSVYYSQVLFYTKTTSEQFRETVEYKVYPATYLSARSFDRYVFGVNSEKPDDKGSYILRRGQHTEALAKAGFRLEEHGVFVLAYRP